MTNSRREFSQTSSSGMYFSVHLIPFYLFHILSFRCWLPTEQYTIFAFIGPMVAIIVVSFLTLTRLQTNNTWLWMWQHIKLAFHWPSFYVQWPITQVLAAMYYPGGELSYFNTSANPNHQPQQLSTQHIKLAFHRPNFTMANYTSACMKQCIIQSSSHVVRIYYDFVYMWSQVRILYM